LYFMALTQGLAPVPEIPAAVRAEADALRLGDLDAMREGLDAETTARIDLANPARVQRAWEVLRATGRGLAAWQSAAPVPLLPRAWAEALVLRPDVTWLDARIAARFSGMLDSGALSEVAAELPFWNPDRPSARAIGAVELREHLLGRLSLPQAAEAARLATRQYAKRQRTWFRARMKDWQDLTPM
jgi:tRNA dimethylallyltransferase